MKYILITMLFLTVAATGHTYASAHAKHCCLAGKADFMAPPDSQQYYATHPKTILQNVWKLNQLYYDSVAATVDSVMAKFRLIPSRDAMLYMNDGKNKYLFYWNMDEADANRLSIYADKNNMSDASMVFSYEIVYKDPSNLILRLDLKGKNAPVGLIEYRLIPDPDFFQ